MWELSDFTIDTERFNIEEMKKIYDVTSEEGVNYVPIIDAGIAMHHNDSINRLTELNCSILSTKRGG